jgi:hypothetical protein
MKPLGDDVRQNGEHPLPHLDRGVNVLQAAQSLRNVVPRFGVQHDGGDVHLTELQLGADDLAHGVSNDEVSWVLIRFGAECPWETGVVYILAFANQLVTDFTRAPS